MTVEDFATRRDPDAILRQITEAEQAAGDTRGKLKIFFGYAAGVGKTLRDAPGSARHIGEGLRRGGGLSGAPYPL